MAQYSAWSAALLAGGCVLLAGTARAQSAADAAHEHRRVPVGVGGEVTAALSRPDHEAYFNYTNYEQDALRLGRLRLFGEWRPAARFSILGEVRTENADHVSVAAMYARWQPSSRHDLFIHAGRIPPVIGAFARHAYGRDNLVTGLPLAYQYLTSLRADALPESVDDLLRMRGRGWRPAYPVGSTSTAPGIPLISGTRWDTGVSASWRRRWLEASGSVTLGAPSVPTVRETNGGRTWAGRVAARLPQGLTAGVSAARGAWLEDSVLQLIPDGLHRPGSESILGVDVEAGAGRWLVRHEWWRATFDVPLGADRTNLRLTAWSGFIEGRYRFHPRWQSALRVERLQFGTVQSRTSGALGWDADVDRAEFALGFRATRSAELRAGWQYNWRTGGRIHARGYPTASAIYWF